MGVNTKVGQADKVVMALEEKDKLVFSSRPSSKSMCNMSFLNEGAVHNNNSRWDL